jgi:hypothetical protein
VTQPINNADSDSDVQEIDPPVLLRSMRKRHRRRILRESIDRRFCRCSPRNKKRNEEDNTAASSLHPIQTEDKQVTNFMTVTICTVRVYQAYCFLMPHPDFHVSTNPSPIVATSQFPPVEVPPSEVPVSQIMPYGPPSQKVNIQCKFDP